MHCESEVTEVVGGGLDQIKLERHLVIVFEFGVLAWAL